MRPSLSEIMTFWSFFLPSGRIFIVFTEVEPTCIRSTRASESSMGARGGRLGHAPLPHGCGEAALTHDEGLAGGRLLITYMRAPRYNEGNILPRFL